MPDDDGIQRGQEGIDLVNAKLKELGPEFVIATDLDRVWATGVQAFVNPMFTMMVFREQNVLTDDNGAPPRASLKNVASVILPTDVARDLHRVLGEQLSGIAGNGEQQ